MRRILTVIVLAGALSACGTSDATNAPAAATSAPSAAASTITVTNVWARPVVTIGDTKPTDTAAAMGDAKPTGMAAAGGMAEGGANGAMYLTISNSGAADQLVKANGDIAKSIELHTVIKNGDVMQMRPVESIDVPAGASVALKPGGFHVMLIGLNRELKLGDTFDITLQFKQAGPVVVQAVVKQPE